MRQPTLAAAQVQQSPAPSGPHSLQNGPIGHRDSGSQPPLPHKVHPGRSVVGPGAQKLSFIHAPELPLPYRLPWQEFPGEALETIRVTTPRTFRCLIGSEARRQLEASGCSPDAFRLLLAASGGPRWLGLVGIDRALTRFLRGRSPQAPRLPLLGSSSGAWRVAAMCSDDDGTAYDELEEEYISQRYEGKPKPDFVSAHCRQYLTRIFTPERLEHAIHRSPFQMNFSTAIFRRERLSKARMIAAIAGLPFLNAVDRRWMGYLVQRGLFTAGHGPDDSPLKGQPAWDNYPTRTIPLDATNFVPGLLASGSIPFVLAGESAIPGAGRGHHVDGGLLDYHFEVETGGPVLYPHFSADPLPGWMDRFPPYRRLSRSARSHLCLILPSEEQLSHYPGNFYPGRVDFYQHSNDERIARWRATVKANGPLEKELAACLEAGDLLKVSEPF